MRVYKDEKSGDTWIEYTYRSGYGFASNHHNLSEESRETGLTLEQLEKSWRELDEMTWEDHIGSD